MRYLILFTLCLIFVACSSKKMAVSFQFKRTPLNPIAYHEGVSNYFVVVDSRYSDQYQQALADFTKETQRLKREHDSLVVVYNATFNRQRVLEGLTEPQLVLPNPPPSPFKPTNFDALAQLVHIQGMQRGSENALFIRAEFQGLEKGKTSSSKKAVKSKEENTPMDTTMQFSIPVKNPILLRVEAPNRSEPIIAGLVTSTNRFKSVQGKALIDTTESRKTFQDALQKEEQEIFRKNMLELNDMLNSEFGTSVVQRNAQLEVFESNKNHSYDDLVMANDFLKMGLILLSGNRNEAFQNINAALVIYRTEMAQYNASKKSRINPNIMKSILKNATVASIYSENWESALSYLNQLKTMKLKSADKADVGRLTSEYNDLKARFDALNK